MFRRFCGQLQPRVLLLEVTFSRLAGTGGAVNIDKHFDMAQAVQKLVAKVPTLVGGKYICFVIIHKIHPIMEN